MEEVKAELVQSVKEEIASINNIDNTSLGENKIDELKIEEIVIEEDANAISEQVENREEYVEEAIPRIQYLMAHPFGDNVSLNLELRADADSGDSYQEAK